MKKVLAYLAIFVSMLSMAPVKKTKVIFFGDSITQAGVQPNGYITKVQDYLSKNNKSENYELIGAGIGGNKIYDLYLRMEEDVLAKQPDVVVIYVGINDVWHKSSSGTGTDKDKFGKFYTAIIKKLQAQNIKVILCTPSVIGELKENTNQQDGDLNFYSDIIRKLAASNNCGLIDLRKAFNENIQNNNPNNKESGILTTDRVHLNEAGNQLVADEMIKALGM
jgi:lysophospholipase L1-like esterase